VWYTWWSCVFTCAIGVGGGRPQEDIAVVRRDGWRGARRNSLIYLALAESFFIFYLQLSLLYAIILIEKKDVLYHFS